jgi:hypothetical protein
MSNFLKILEALSDPYKEGKKASVRDEKRSSNPYNKTREKTKWKAWDEGWFDHDQFESE